MAAYWTLETQSLSFIATFLKKLERISCTFHEHPSWHSLRLLYSLGLLFHAGTILIQPCLNALMLLLKKAPRICSTTAADCYQYISAVLFLRFHTRNGLYKVCEQGNRTSIIFNCLKLVPGAGSWYMSRPGLTWLGFAVVKPVFSGLMQVLGSLDVISSDKITWIIAA